MRQRVMENGNGVKTFSEIFLFFRRKTVTNFRFPLFKAKTHLLTICVKYFQLNISFVFTVIVATAYAFFRLFDEGNDVFFRFVHPVRPSDEGNFRVGELLVVVSVVGFVPASDERAVISHLFRGTEREGVFEMLFQPFGEFLETDAEFDERKGSGWTPSYSLPNGALPFLRNRRKTGCSK